MKANRTKIVEKDGLWGVSDAKGCHIIPCRYAAVKEVNGGYAVQNTDGLWGVCDEEGATLLPCQWKEVTVRFHNVVEVKDSHGLWGLADRTGKLVAPCRWTEMRYHGQLLFQVRDKAGKQGIMVTTGEMLTPCRWDAVAPVGDRYNCFALTDLAQGRVSVIDPNGRAVAEYEGIAVQYLYSDQYKIQSTEGLWGVVGRKGEMRVDCQWQDVEMFNGRIPYCQNRATRRYEPSPTMEVFCGYKVWDASGNTHLVDWGGNLLPETQWQDRRSEAIRCIDITDGQPADCFLFDDYRKVTFGDGLWGFEKSGEIRTECQWKDIEGFVWHKAEDTDFDNCVECHLVRVTDTDGKYGLIDLDGQIISPCQWNEIEWLYQPKSGKADLFRFTDDDAVRIIALQ